LTLDECRAPLKGSVRVGRRMIMEGRGSFTLEFEQEFWQDKDTHDG